MDCCSSIVGGVYACTSHLGERTKCVFPPLNLSLAAKARHCVVRGREAEVVEVGLVRLRDER
jgi:hypothetical protein